MRFIENKFYIAFFWVTFLTILLVPANWIVVNNDNWLPPDHPQEINLNYLSDEFSPGDDLVVALKMPQGFFNISAIKKFSQIEQALKQYLGQDLISNRSPLSATSITNNKNIIEVESFSNAFLRGAYKSLSDYKKAFDASPYSGRLLSLDNKIAAIHLRLDTRNLGEKRAKVIDKVRAVLAYEGYKAGKDYHFIAKAALKNEMNQQTQKALLPLLGTAILILLAFLWLSLGRLKVSVIIVIVAGLCVQGAVSAMVLFGHPMSVVTIILPVLAAVIAVAHSLHIIFYQRNSSDNEGQKIISYMWKPCLIANFTTAIGAGSFIFSGLVPLENFGWDSILTLVLLYITVMASFWFLLDWKVMQKPTKISLAQKQLNKILNVCHDLSGKYKKQISFTGIVLMLLFAAGLVRFHTETNFLAVFFKPESQIRKDFTIADKHLGGSGVVGVIIKQDSVDKFKELESFDITQDFVKRLLAHPKVNYAEAIDIPIGLAHHAFTGKKQFPNSDSQLAQELLFLELSRNEAKDDILSPYVNFDYSATHIHLRTPDLSSTEINKMLKEIEATKQNATQIGEVILTGFNVFMAALGKEVLETQISSLALTMGIIFCIFVFIFGWRIGMLGFLSNIVPITILLGTIAWIGTSFDVVMVLVASITLGLMVDDSIHFLHRWREARLAGANNTQARSNAFAITGTPIILTSLLFCAGFAVFLLSDLALLVKFGIWVMVGLAVDMISSVLFLPALLAFFARKD